MLEKFNVSIKSIFKILFPLFILFMIALFIYDHFIYTNEEILKDKWFADSYNGKVVNKFINQKNHNIKVIVLDTEKKITVPSVPFLVYDSIRLGDILQKEPYSEKGVVIRDVDTIFIYEIPH